MTPYMLTIGTVMSVPRMRDSARRRISRRMISTPFSSSPCTAAHTNSVGARASTRAERARAWSWVSGCRAREAGSSRVHIAAGRYELPIDAKLFRHPTLSRGCASCVASRSSR